MAEALENLRHNLAMPGEHHQIPPIPTAMPSGPGASASSSSTEIPNLVADQVTNAVATALASSPDRATRAAHDPINKALPKPTEEVSNRVAEQFGKIDDKLRAEHKTHRKDLEIHLHHTKSFSDDDVPKVLAEAIEQKQKTVAAKASVVERLHQSAPIKKYMKMASGLRREANQVDMFRRSRMSTPTQEDAPPKPVPEHVDETHVAKAFDELLSDAHASHQKAVQDLAKATVINMETDILKKLNEDLHAKAHVVKFVHIVAREGTKRSSSSSLKMIGDDDELIDVEADEGAVIGAIDNYLAGTKRASSQERGSGSGKAKAQVWNR